MFHNLVIGLVYVMRPHTDL